MTDRQETASSIDEQAHLLRKMRLALQNHRYDEARQVLESAVQLAREAEDWSAVSRHLGNLALVYNRLSQPEQALDCLGQALDIARRENDRLTEDGLLGNIGNILREIGRPQDAITYLNQALSIAQEIGDVRGRGIWLGNLGLALSDTGAHVEALSAHREAVAVARTLRDQRSLAARLNNLGQTYLQIGQTSEAIKCFHETVALHRALGELSEAAFRMHWIGGIYNDLGQGASSDFEARFYYELACDAYREALTMARELGDNPTEAELLASLGGTYGNLGSYEQAVLHFSAAFELFTQLGAADRLPALEESLNLAYTLLGGHR